METKFISESCLAWPVYFDAGPTFPKGGLDPENSLQQNSRHIFIRIRTLVLGVTLYCMKVSLHFALVPVSLLQAQIRQNHR